MPSTGHHNKALYAKYPLNLFSPHPRYSFHTMFDGKDCGINDVKDHRVLIARINIQDARKRNITKNSLVKLFNDRGAVIFAAHLTDRLPPGTVQSAEGSAHYDPIGEPGESPDLLSLAQCGHG